MCRVQVSLEHRAARPLASSRTLSYAAMSGVAIAGIPESIWDTFREHIGKWQSQVLLFRVLSPRTGLTKGPEWAMADHSFSPGMPRMSGAWGGVVKVAALWIG